MMKNAVLDEQIAYYRARAQEYDKSILSVGNVESAGPDEKKNEASNALTGLHLLLSSMGPYQNVLELACGTGIWTQTLVTIGQDITVIDAAPEMLDITRQKLGDSRIRYQQANIFEWTPTETYDLVFFAFWLSHVPPDALDAFLSNVQRAVKAGGQLVIIDQHAPTDEDRSIAENSIYATRPLLDGRRFTIVKVFYELPLLQGRLAALEFEATIHWLNETFFFLSAPRSQE